MELDNARLQRQVLQLEAELRKERGDKDSPHQAELTKYKTRTRTLEMNLKSEQGRNSARIAELTAQADKAAGDVAAASKETAECRAEIAALEGKKRALEKQLKDALEAGAWVRAA
jgi:chromosome segregation ATPase